MEAKFLIWLCLDILGGIFATRTIIGTIDNIKEVILFIILMSYALARFYFYVRRSWVRVRREEWEQRQREKVK